MTSSAPGPPPARPRPRPPPGLRRLCAALCYNQHFPTPMAALWSLSFLLALLPITLLRLLHPHGHARRGAEGDDDPNMAAGGTNMAAGGANMAAGHTNMAAEHTNMAAGHTNMAAGHTSMATEHINMAAGRANMATRHDREGGGKGSSGEDKMAASQGHKMATGCRASGKAKMAAWPCPGDESSALMWMDESDVATRPRPSHEPNVASGHRPTGKSKMAAWHHPANESSAAPWSGESKMAAGRYLTHVSGEPRPATRPRPPAGSDMAARRRPTPGANMAAGPPPPSPTPALPALPPPGGHDGRGRWRVWLGAGAAAMLAVGEGGFLWAVLWRQLPAVTAVPIGCRLPAAPCPPLSCALPARADKMAALLGIAASAAVSLIAVMAAAIMAAARALRGRVQEGEGPA